MTKDEIKALMSAAAGSDGQADESWKAGGVERLYFHDPRDINSAGLIEVRDSEEPQYVRLELFLSPERAAAVLKFVTGQAVLVERLIPADVSDSAPEAEPFAYAAS